MLCFTDLAFYTLVKGRTNIELREQLTDSEGKKSLYNEDGTISAVGPITKVCEGGIIFEDNFVLMFCC